MSDDSEGWVPLLALVLIFGGAWGFLAYGNHKAREKLAEVQAETKRLTKQTKATVNQAQKHRARVERLQPVLRWLEAEAHASGTHVVSPAQPRRYVEVFWPDTMVPHPDGYLMTERTFIPIRALARRADVPCFTDAERRTTDGTLTTWVPHYVFQKRGEALLVGPRATTPEGDRRWVLQDDCFCWITRECLNIEEPTTVYASRQDLVVRRAPLGEYAYPFADHFVPGTEGAPAGELHAASLPVLRREEGRYWCVVRPTEDRGYETCWLEWDGESPAVQCRIRASRREFEEYLNGIRKLMVDFKNSEQRTAAKTEVYDRGQAWLTMAGQVNEHSRIKARLEGVPKLDGFLAKPIEANLQYEKARKQCIKLLNLSSADIWDVNDVAYIRIEELP